MTSDQVKELLIGRFTFANGFVGAVYESANLNAADVLAVRFGGKVQEYEIKVSKADLVGEMRAARVAAGLEGVEQYARKQIRLAIDENREMTFEQRDVLLKHGHTLSKTKLEKHRLYIAGEGRDPGEPWPGFKLPLPFVPSHFYWCIPMELLETCQALNKGLPYGIYVFDTPPTSKYYPPKCVSKAARDLKGQGDKVFFELFSRACTQWADDRRRVARLKIEIQELKAARPQEGGDVRTA